jgi:Domain of unknown function (DUF4406)
MIRFLHRCFARIKPVSKTRVYLAGGMTGHPELNFPLFHRMAASLRASGYEVMNPAEICPDPTAKWEDCMRADLAALVTCDAIALLPGWEKSRGASLEHTVAMALGMRPIFLQVAA